MPAEREVIDLDERDQRATAGVTDDHLLAGRRTAVQLVAAFVVGVLLGGFAVSELWGSQEERARNSSVALVAFPASIGGGGTDALGVLQLDGQLAVINAGPAPITVRAATGQGQGVLVRDTGTSRSLRPGGTTWIDVELCLDCVTAFGSEPLSMRFSVETGDGRISEFSYPIALVGSMWQVGTEQLCANLRAMEKRGGGR
ncbi:hypothetical protein [Micromonospora avicenniae]|uniref:hypothetical protein n=1 Tax=Micromonospora avicenniae TaxID=1198245 RepID=UPI0033165502